MNGIKVAMMVCGMVAGVVTDAVAEEAGAASNPPAAPAGEPASSMRSGVTFEANLGLGWLRVSPDEGMTVTESALGGLNLGIGGWVAPRAALTFRIAGATYSEEEGSITSGFAGGALQLWANDTFWAGGGVGLGFVSLDLEEGPDPEVETGLGLNVRVGITADFNSSHSLNVSFEASPVFLEGGTITSMGLLLGYQYL